MDRHHWCAILGDGHATCRLHGSSAGRISPDAKCLSLNTSAKLCCGLLAENIFANTLIKSTTLMATPKVVVCIIWNWSLRKTTATLTLSMRPLVWHGLQASCAETSSCCSGTGRAMIFLVVFVETATVPPNFFLVRCTETL